MEGNTVLHQLMSVRIEIIINGITENDVFYQETKQRAGEYSDKLDALQLPKETKLLIDRYASEHIANGSRYGELANQLGFSMGKRLPKQPFSGFIIYAFYFYLFYIKNEGVA